MKKLVTLLSTLSSVQAFAHEGVGTFTVQSMAPGYWICNAKVTDSGQASNPNGGTWTRSNVVGAKHENQILPPVSAMWLNPTGMLRKNNGVGVGIGVNKPYALTEVLFSLKSPTYNAQYTVDLCTSDPGPGNNEDGNELSNFKAFASASELVGRDVDGYLTSAAVQFGAEVACGNSTSYNPDTLQFNDNKHVGKVVLDTDLDVVASGVWTSAGTISNTDKARYCVTRFVFNETSVVARSNFLEGGVFTIRVSQTE